VVGLTIGSRGKVPGKTCEKRIRNDNNNNNNNNTADPMKGEERAHVLRQGAYCGCGFESSSGH
jgi:hypothetical protein